MCVYAYQLTKIDVCMYISVDEDIHIYRVLVDTQLSVLDLVVVNEAVETHNHGPDVVVVGEGVTRLQLWSGVVHF
jgi:hypothetical protein